MPNPIPATGGGQVVGGVTGFTYDGASFGIASDSAKYGTGGWSAESITGASGRLGRTESAAVPFIEVKVHLPTGATWGEIQALREGTAILTCVDREVTLTLADVTGAVEVDPKDNSATVRFEGLTCKEVG